MPRAIPRAGPAQTITAAIRGTQAYWPSPAEAELQAIWKTQLILSIKKIGMPRAGGWVHNFTGSAEMARDLMRYGLSFSLGGVLAYCPSRKRSDMMKAIYPDHLLLETDSPDIPPVGAEFPNEPANLRLVLAAAARILDVPEGEIASATTANAMRMVPALAW